MQKEDSVRILWTGGWDSTYRMVELSRMPVKIQPVYIVDESRASRDYELKAMQRIVEKLEARPETIATFCSLVLVKKSDIPENKAITDAFETVHQKTHLGIQHEWIARYACLNPGIEIGTEAGVPETSHIIDAIQSFGDLVKRGDTFVLNPETSSEAGMLVLGNLEFPIVDKTEEQMLENIREWKYEDIMKEIWFCHSPIDGRPCGLCHPCAVKMESHMEFLLPDEAQKRYRIQKRLARIIGRRMSEAITRRTMRR